VRKAGRREGARERKANLNVVSTEWKSTALQQALDAEKLDTAQILRDAGARDVSVTEKNGEPVGENSEPARAALKYLDAIQRRDLAAMQNFSTRKLEGVTDWKALTDSRPVKASSVSGFASEDAATVSVRGKRSDGVFTTWTLQLVRFSEGWKISDERWETRLDSKEP
jgi:hypothetical protein